MKPFNDRPTNASSFPFSKAEPAGQPAPPFPPAYAIGRDSALAIEWEWSTWRDAVADRASDLRKPRRRRSNLGWAAAAIAGVFLVDAALVLGIAELARFAAANPRPTLAVMLAAGAFAGVAIGRRIE